MTDTWYGWPPQGATKGELIEAARRRLAWYEEANRRRQEEYAEKLAEWEATIADRLLALIPDLRAGRSPDVYGLRDGGWVPFTAPQPWGDIELVSDRNRLATLEALPDGIVPMEFRSALSMDWPLTNSG